MFSWIGLAAVIKDSQSKREGNLMLGFHIQLIAAFILLRADPCLNQSICWALKVWSSTIVSVLPSACVSTQFRGTPGAKDSSPTMATLSSGLTSS